MCPSQYLAAGMPAVELFLQNQWAHSAMFVENGDSFLLS